MREKILKANLNLGLFILLLSSLLLASGFPLMKAWYYCFAWWSFILVLDSLNFRRVKSSPLAKSAGDFLFFAFISVFIWLVFEIINWRVQNWSYHGLPQSAFVRWPGYFIAFATVLPAFEELSFFFSSLAKRKRPAPFDFRATPLVLSLSLAFGAGILALALAWPRLFFPLVWIGFIFLLEPLNFWLGVDSLVSDLERKDLGRIGSWLLAGLSAGFFWEFWNYWAGSHWEYHLPYLNFWRVFQMPAFGYGGFLPFGLEVFAFRQLLSFLWTRIRNRKALAWVAAIGLIIFYAVVFYGIDHFTLVPERGPR